MNKIIRKFIVIFFALFISSTLCESNVLATEIEEDFGQGFNNSKISKDATTHEYYYHDFTIKKGETYEITNSHYLLIPVLTGSVEGNFKKGDAIIRDASNVPVDYLVDGYLDAFGLFPYYSVKITAKTSDIWVSVPVDIKDSIKKVNTPTFHKFNINKNESYEFISTNTIPSYVVIANGNSARIDSVNYDINNSFIYTNGNVKNFYWFYGKDKTRFTLVQGDKAEIVIPYEDKNSLKKVSTPAIHRVVSNKGETYEIKNTLKPQVRLSADRENPNTPHEYIKYNSDGSVKTSSASGNSDLRIDSGEKLKITTKDKTTYYIPYELKSSSVKSSTSCFHKNKIIPGYNYKFKNISKGGLLINSDYAERGATVNYKIYDGSGVLQRSENNYSGDVYLSQNETAIIGLNKGSELNLAVPSEYRYGVTAEYIDISNHFGVKDIKWFASKGYLDKTLSYFRPNDSITRAEFVKMVNGVFGYKNRASSNPFNDVKSNSWYYNEVLIAVENGYISKSNKNFRPDDPITRQEVANIITTITKTKDQNLDKLQKYVDKDLVSDTMKSSVEGAIEQGFMGVNSTTFNPRKNITRGEAVVTLTRVAK